MMNNNLPNAHDQTNPQESTRSEVFETGGIQFSDILDETEALQRSFDPIPHKDICQLLLDNIEQIDFREKAAVQEETEKLQKKHYIVIVVDEFLKAAIRNNWRLCRNNDQTFIYNGAYWKAFDRELLKSILGEAASRMGMPSIDARYFPTRQDLMKQFESDSYLPAPERRTGTTLINLKNGTFEITEEHQYLRPPLPDDFLTYQLPFSYDSSAGADLFMAYLERVLPDIECQAVLQEFLGYIFISTKTLKLEKVLLLIGSGANGKSVFIEIVNALLGRENVSSYSLQTLTDSRCYTRAELATKLLNCASEISGKIDTNDFKLLASGEPIEARRIYGSPFTMEGYAKLMFATNELPKDVEQTNGYFRRWLIVPFDETIPEDEQDKELARKIIDSELSGVFNWVLEGLQRLLANKKFTESNAVARQLLDFKIQSDSVLLFSSDPDYISNTWSEEPLKDLYARYQDFCKINGFRPCSNRTFSERLLNAGFKKERRTYGMVIFRENKLPF